MVGEEIIGKLIDHFHSPKYLLVISIISGFLIFGEINLIYKLALLSFVETYRLWIGIVFLISSGFWLVDLIQLIINKIKNKYKILRNNKIREERLKQLTTEEKVILGKYINSKTRTQKLVFSSGIVNELERYKIIYRSSDSVYAGEVSYNIQPWAWDYLNKHKELLNNCESIELIEL